jgi:predicted nucleic acid-binding protein
MPSTGDPGEPVFFDAGLFIAAILQDDPRHTEARPYVEAARAGGVRVVTSPGVLCEVYAALTWEKTEPRHDPVLAAHVVGLLVEHPSHIEVLESGLAVSRRALRLAGAHGLTARRAHDAHHAATALVHGVSAVYTVDATDWRVFERDGLHIMGPPSVLLKLSARTVE